MNWSSRWNRVTVRIVTLILLSGLAGILFTAPVLAEGGLALSGSFHNQNFVIPQGASVSGPGINVVVFNKGSDSMNIRMSSQSPPGVTISFSIPQFAIAPGGQQQVLIGVEIGADVSPGNYDLSVTAQSYTEGGTGIQIAGAAGQTAKLNVTGESAQVDLRALSPDGKPLVATVRLYRIVNGQDMEVAYSDTGTLHAVVTPGEFKAASYIGGQQVTVQSFNLVKDERKSIDLTGATVYFASFGVLPAYANDSGKLAFAQIVYTVKNIYQQVDKGDVNLQVTINGKKQSLLTLVTLSPLAVGSSGLTYNYTPVNGWVDGNYDFQIQLNLDGKLYTSSLTEHLIVGSGEPTPAGTSAAPGITETNPTPGSNTSNPTGISPYLFGGVIAIVVLIAVILIFWFRRKK